MLSVTCSQVSEGPVPLRELLCTGLFLTDSDLFSNYLADVSP